MSIESPQQPLWLRSRSLPVAGIAVVATAIAWLCSSLVPAVGTSLDWALYDRWIQRHPLPVAESAVVLITRDPATDSRFGAGAWDRALIARLISAVHDAGATVIGVDLNLLESSPPQLGGPGSDAQLDEVTDLVGHVVYPLVMGALTEQDGAPDSHDEHGAEWSHSSWLPLPSPSPMALPPLASPVQALPPVAHHAKGIGHLAGVPDPDHVIRRVPLYLSTPHRAIPAFGLLLAAAYYQVPATRIIIGPETLTLPDAHVLSGKIRTITVPTDRQGTLLTHDPGDGTVPPFLILSFEDVWASIEQDDPSRLRPTIEGKVALLFPRPSSPSATAQTSGHSPESLKRHLHLLNTLLTGQWTRRISEPWSWLLALLLAGSMAWGVLRGAGWTGPALALGLLAAYLALSVGLLLVGQWMLPLTLPLSAGLVAVAATLAWDRLATAQRLHWLERDRLRAEEDSSPSVKY
jgi:CHASE2 domain-containing sensor protein